MYDLQDAATSAPIFVGGEHRSGTTLLAAILDSHPRIVFGLEVDFLEPADLGPHLLECLRRLRAGEKATLAHGTPLAEFHWGVQFIRQCDSFGVDPAALEPLVRGVMNSRRSDLQEFRDRCALVHAIGEHRRTELGVLHWGLKIQRTIVQARELAEFWPRARFVHIVRDARDVAASHVRDQASWGYREVGAAAAGWSRLVEATRPLRASPRFYELRYEDLIQDARATLLPLMDFLNLPWDDSLLSHSQARHTFLKPGSYEHPSTAAIQKPIHGGAMQRYRKDLPAANIESIERIAGPWLTALGYPVDFHGGPS